VVLVGEGVLLAVVLVPEGVLLMALALPVMPLPLLAVVPAALPVPLAVDVPGADALAVVPLMLYFCSRSETRELNADNCCRTPSTSVAVGAVVLDVATEDVVSVVLLAGGIPAPGAGVVLTTLSSLSVHAASAVQSATALAANFSLVGIMDPSPLENNG
jgi:hypothetical protein